MSEKGHESDTDMNEVKAPSAAGEVTAAYQPTPKEHAFFYSICMNLIGKPEVNWNMVAQECGHKDASITKIRFQQILKKCGERGGHGGNVATSSFSTPTKKGVARKTPVKSATKPPAHKASSTNDNGAGVGTIKSRTNGSPMKVQKAKAPARKKANVKLSELNVNEDEVDTDMAAFQTSPHCAFKDETDI